jgi:hypothetical protein
MAKKVSRDTTELLRLVTFLDASSIGAAGRHHANNEPNPRDGQP